MIGDRKKSSAQPTAEKMLQEPRITQQVPVANSPPFIRRTWTTTQLPWIRTRTPGRSSKSHLSSRHHHSLTYSNQTGLLTSLCACTPQSIGSPCVTWRAKYCGPVSPSSARVDIPVLLGTGEQERTHLGDDERHHRRQDAERERLQQREAEQRADLPVDIVRAQHLIGRRRWRLRRRRRRRH